MATIEHQPYRKASAALWTSTGRHGLCRVGLPVLGAMLAAVCAVCGAPAKKPAATNAPVVIPKSVFVVPASPAQGRDPFFPNSTRLFAQATEADSQALAAAEVVLNGVSGLPGHRFAMINGETFAQGDEAEIKTPSGRVHVKCLEIGPDWALIDVSGQRRELHLRPGL